ncbi:MAG: dephospho-CoA kinase [Eubacteriales bacterium]|jgi:gluconate kinase|nr:dephospho-CoA kinase [Eubacteriales bacterium]
MIICPNCGVLTKNDISVYSEELRKQNFLMSPVLPVCIRCGREVQITHTCNGGHIIALNGTCGSGKSAVAEILAGKGFLAIDGDCVIQTVKHRKKVKQVGFNEMADEIAREIDILSLFGNRFVLSTVILPEDLSRYKEIFESRNLKYRFILLKPEYRTAVERCRSRTCHTSVTPEYWIKHFYELLRFDGGVIVADNTNQTPEETAAYILRAFNKNDENI